MNEIKSQNISGINELIQISNKHRRQQQMKLCRSVDLLHIDQQYKNRVKAYLLNKYCSMSLTDIGKMIGRSANATRMIIKRFEQQFSQNPDLFTALIP